MKLARVTKVYRDASQERHATEYNGAYAVDVVFVDSKLADTEEECKSVFLAMSSEDDFSYPDEGSIVGVGVYENTSISYVDHITPFGKLVPALLPGQRQIGDAQSHILVDTDQSKIDIESDEIDIDGDEYRNKVGNQQSIGDQVSFISEFILNLISKGDINLNALGFLDIKAGRFSISGTENSTLTTTQYFNETVGLGKSSVVGLGDTKTIVAGNYKREIITGLFDLYNPSGSLNDRLKAPFINLDTSQQNDANLMDLINLITVTTAGVPSSIPNNSASFILHKATILANKALIPPQTALIDLFAL